MAQIPQINTSCITEVANSTKDKGEQVGLWRNLLGQKWLSRFFCLRKSVCPKMAFIFPNPKAIFYGP